MDGFHQSRVLDQRFHTLVSKHSLILMYQPTTSKVTQIQHRIPSVKHLHQVLIGVKFHISVGIWKAWSQCEWDVHVFKRGVRLVASSGPSTFTPFIATNSHIYVDATSSIIFPRQLLHFWPYDVLPHSTTLCPINSSEFQGCIPFHINPIVLDVTVISSWIFPPLNASLQVPILKSSTPIKTILVTILLTRECELHLNNVHIRSPRTCMWVIALVKHA